MWFRQILNFRVKDFKFCDFVRIFIKFVQFWSKIEILWSRVKDFKFWFSLGLRISNFTNLPKSKFYKNHQILSKKFLISQILWVLGRGPRPAHRAGPLLRLFPDFAKRGKISNIYLKFKASSVLKASYHNHIISSH